MTSPESNSSGPDPDGVSAEDAEREFVKGLKARHEAVPPTDGELAAGATHEIVEPDDDDGEPVVRRGRFSAF